MNIHQLRVRNVFHKPGIAWVFAGMCSVVLILSGVGKLVYLVLGGDGTLNAPNPLFLFLNDGNVLLVAAIVECIVGSGMLIKKSLGRKMILLTWFCSVLILYRTGLYLTAGTVSCGCLVGVEGFLGMSKEVSNNFSKVFLGIMAIGCWAYWWGTCRSSDVAERGKGDTDLYLNS